MVVVGAGFIGLELASVAAARGCSVHVLELAERPLLRGLSERTAELVRHAHEGWGVGFGFSQSVLRLDGDAGHVRSVTTSEGATLPADLVVYGIGVLPNTDLAQQAGLAVDDGIVVDARLLTSDPDVSAVGDAVRFPCVHAAGALTRLESVQNAADQARHVAARLTGRGDGPYDALPWFWSDQGELKVQVAGLSTGHDHTVELAAEEPGSTVLCFRAGVLVAVETIDRPLDHMAARRLLAGPAGVTVQEASRPGFALAGVAA